jgi:hypothetical protein
MYPISIHAFKSVIEFWLNILKSQDTLLYEDYQTNRSLLDSFATRIKILLNKLHFSHVWDNQSTFSNKSNMNPTENEGELGCSGMVGSVTLVTKPVANHK